jgi:hypothetical protein
MQAIIFYLGRCVICRPHIYTYMNHMIRIYIYIYMYIYSNHISIGPCLLFLNAITCPLSSCEPTTLYMYYLYVANWNDVFSFN